MKHINKKTEVDYGLALQLNGGEDEVTVLFSPGQSGHSNLVIIHMSIDGGIAGVSPVVCNINYGIPLEELPAKVQEVLTKHFKKTWATGMSQAQAASVAVEIATAVYERLEGGAG